MDYFLRHLTSQPRARTLTMDELIANDRAPTLIIRRLPSDPLTGGPRIVNAIDALLRVITNVAGAFNDSSSNLFVNPSGKTEKPADAKTTARNKAKMNEHLDRMRDELLAVVRNGIQRSVAEMDNMTPEQQDELIEFWEHIKKFIDEFLAWFDRTMDTIFAKLLEGYHIDCQLVSGIFNKAVEELNHAIASLPSSHQEQSNLPHQRQGVPTHPAPGPTMNMPYQGPGMSSFQQTDMTFQAPPVAHRQQPGPSMPFHQGPAPANMVHQPYSNYSGTSYQGPPYSGNQYH